MGRLGLWLRGYWGDAAQRVDWERGATLVTCQDVAAALSYTVLSLLLDRSLLQTNV